MSIDIDWLAFVRVFVVALIGAVVVVGAYATGLRLLVRAGRVPVVAPAEFTDAITVISPKQAARAEKAAAKAARKSPLSPGQKMLARIGAYASFALCAVAVAAGILLIVVH
ncbi:peptidase [Microbacterium protaetiae]|uniref:Peptidase n=1 Tax=Microbacterium protaetiae TaxID=2509458 RepID=A0A4P6EEW4_9MICO|nr:peptidase [Microbacterium protaetiae]QAY60764.1 peptidase [Microbacterium protaetiae]